MPTPDDNSPTRAASRRRLVAGRSRHEFFNGLLAPLSKGPTGNTVIEFKNGGRLEIESGGPYDPVEVESALNEAAAGQKVLLKPIPQTEAPPEVPPQNPPQTEPNETGPAPSEASDLPETPYINRNPKATPTEIDTGTLLHRLAEQGKLSGVKSVEGAAEIKGQRSADYRFNLSDGRQVPADLVEPTVQNPAAPAGRIIEKQSQARVVIIRLGKGASGQMPIDKLKIEVRTRVFETPDVNTERVLIMSQSGEIIADMVKN